MVIMLKSLKAAYVKTGHWQYEKKHILMRLRLVMYSVLFPKFSQLFPCPKFNKLNYNYYRRLLFQTKPVKIQFTLKAQAETSHAVAVVICWLF